MSGAALPWAARILSQVAKRIGYDIHDAAAIGMSMDERGLSNQLILALQRRFDKYLKITAFTQQQEAFNGADWEIHFLGAWGPPIPLRVQAKREYRGRFNFAYAGSGSTSQVDTLIAAALADSMFPAYVVFADRVNQMHPPCRCTQFVPGTGASVSSLAASEVKKLIKSHQTGTAASLSCARPLQCWAHCLDPATMSWMAASKDYLDDLRSLLVDERDPDRRVVLLRSLDLMVEMLQEGGPEVFRASSFQRFSGLTEMGPEGRDAWLAERSLAGALFLYENLGGNGDH